MNFYHNPCSFSVWRGWIAKRNYQKRLQAAQVIQHYFRCWLTKRREQRRLVEFSGDISAENIGNQSTPGALETPRCSLADENKGNKAPSHFVSFAKDSWFDQLATKTGNFTPHPLHSSVLARKQMTFSFVRGHNSFSPLAVLMANCNAAKIPLKRSSANKQNFTIQTANRSSAILSRREIEKVVLS